MSRSLPGCCSPGAVSIPATAPRPTASPGAYASAASDNVEQVLIPGGPFRFGCDRHEGHAADGEGPSRRVELAAFRMDVTAVCNTRFDRFVDATGYVTDAERLGWSFVFAGLLPDDFEATRGVAAAPWWRQVPGADWRHPDGPHSSLTGRGDHPVVHVSHDDALAFCAWAAKRLPTEAEWEKAARGGLEGARFPWGDAEVPDHVHHCNVWQGRFPDRNDLGDGYYGLAPVDAFEPNGYGLYNMAGNAWEWCADWFTVPAMGADPVAELRAMRGGSYLCHPSYCWRYRVAARSAATPDSTTGHIGFRCVSDIA